jgi:uncharacterized protein GlcG (DUF336 family)
MVRKTLLLVMVTLCVVEVRGQQMPNPYGLPVTIEDAKKAAAAAVAEARKNNFRMAVAVADTGGELVYFEKMDGTQTASVQIAIDKARSAWKEASRS